MKNFMNEAIKLAKKACAQGEVPIGAVIVYDGKIISRGYNTRQTSQNAIKHAEIIAIEKACKKLGSWRLEDCEIFVTLEPCPMCAGAIANARIKTLHYGCKEQTSCDDLCEKILSSKRLNHTVEIIFEENYQEEISSLLSNFFKSKRQKNG
ncbi:MAG: nucleoside deaminase [Clostridia bacterium]|nr:nucleoside deaminase [Clostridia bacterium]